MLVQMVEQMDFTECGYFGFLFEKPKNLKHHQMPATKKKKHTHVSQWHTLSDKAKNTK